jgi:predicted kinase
MDETRATARLPHLDVEIVHRQLPEEQAEQLAINLRASPSLDAFARYLEAQALFWPWLAANPFLAWQRLLQAAWQPWLSRPGLATRPQRLARDD